MKSFIRDLIDFLGFRGFWGYLNTYHKPYVNEVKRFLAVVLLIVVALGWFLRS